jgi:thiamine-monophosphate kinase
MPHGIRPEGVRVISISDEGEFGLIRRIVGRLGAGGALLGPGDDAAVVAAPDGRVVASTDLLIEGRHFRRDWSSAYDVGRKAAAQNLADIVAMGARPTALLVGLASPADLPLTWVDGLADGLRDECALLGAHVVGGDVSAGDAVTVAVAALGDLEGRAPVRRAGATPGDVVVLTGWPGRAAAGLALLQAGRLDDPLADAHRRPNPDYATALTLAASGRATAMIDISDGLLADLGHVAAASGVGIELAAGDLPVDAALVAAASQLGVDAFDWVATGGDDHGFAATVRAGSRVDVPAIGTVVALSEGEPAYVRFTDRGTPTIGGHEHFG